MKGQKFTVVPEFRPPPFLTHSTPDQLLYTSKAKEGGRVRWSRGRGVGGGTDERNDSRRQRRGEGLTFPSRATKAKRLLPPRCTGRDEGRRKRGKMDGLKVMVGGRKVFGDMEVGGCRWGAGVWLLCSHRLAFCILY